MERVARNVGALIKKELAGYFGSAIAYVFIVFFLMMAGFFTFIVSGFYEFGQADLRVFFEWQPWLYLFLVPAVAMRLWAEERRGRTIELLLTLPVTVTEVVVGKFLAAWIFIALALFLTVPLPLSVLYLGDPDLGAIFSGYFGSLLLAGAYLSVGSMTSSLTRNQVVSFIVAVVLCLVFVLVGWEPVINALSERAPLWLLEVVAGFSFVPHFAALERGVVDVRDVLYYMSVIFFMLFANAVILQNRRTA
jgi:ABC-2 type transport system permease protein